jgi:gliding motility-associated-like protein
MSRFAYTLRLSLLTSDLLVGVLFLSVLFADNARLEAQDIVFDASDFAEWSHPRGLVNITGSGVSVRRFEKSFPAVADIDAHSSVTIGDFGNRVVRAQSNQAEGDLIRDQDETTWWQPDPEDPLQLWWIEIDLGRSVVADKVRIIFPDEEGARPFNFFTVFTSPGIPVFGGSAKRIVYNRLGRPINNNTERVVELDLQTTGLRGAAGAHLDTNSTMPFDIIRFIRFEAAAATPDAALAEIEVDGVGFNLPSMVGTPTRREEGDPHWGGTTWTSKDRDCEGCGKGSGADEMLDEDIGFRTWTIEGSDKGDWRDSGVWQVVDFGNVFRVDRVIFLPVVSGRSPILYGYERDKQGAWTNFDLLVSDGTASNSSDPEVEGPFHYDLLSEVVNGTSVSADARFKQHFGRSLFDFNFDPIDLRLLLWRVTTVPQFSRALQLFAFHAEGYPAQVEMESEDISLGSALSIRRVEWDAEVPPGTSIEVQTQTGNGFSTVTRYFLINGSEVTKAAYDAAKSRNRADIVEDNVRDDTWTNWSLPHRFSGQEFQSPSPRQWLRTRVRLISADGAKMPTLRSLRFVANAPVIAAGLQGEIYPHEAALDSLQEFRYTITPGGVSGRDVGFDRVILNLPPGSGDVELVRTTVGGTDVEAVSQVVGDSLVVDLPPPNVRRDSVELIFRSRLAVSPTVFTASVLNSEQEDNSQGVVPTQFGADQVHLPEAVAGRSLVRSLTHTTVFTPNGDGVNDQYQLSFTVVKTSREPRVQIFDLAGQLVTELTDNTPQATRASFTWGGDGDGQRVVPGIYIVRIEVDTDARDEHVHKTVNIVY